MVPVGRRIRAETAAIMAQASHDKFPILGYAIINGVVIGISLVAWYVAKTGLFLPPPAEAAGRPGVAAALVFVPVCFLLATAFDLAWRLFSQKRPTVEEPKRELPRVSVSSTAVKRDVLSREVEKL